MLLSVKRLRLHGMSGADPARSFKGLWESGTLWKVEDWAFERVWETLWKLEDRVFEGVWDSIESRRLGLSGSL